MEKNQMNIGIRGTGTVSPAPKKAQQESSDPMEVLALELNAAEQAAAENGEVPEIPVFTQESQANAVSFDNGDSAMEKTDESNEDGSQTGPDMAVAVPTVIKEPAAGQDTQKAFVGLVDPKKVVTLKHGESPIIKESTRPGFDEMTIKNVLHDRDTSENEGGVVKVRTTGPAQIFGDRKKEGNKVKPQPNLMNDSIKGKFEMAGFNVEYELDGITQPLRIRDYFDDLESAQISVNGDKYLMPMPSGGFKVARITMGAPTISKDERQIFIYKLNKWFKT